MQAVLLNGGAVSVRDVERPEASNGHALLRLRLAGICNTDLELQRGYYGFSGIPGHEFVADVVEAPDPSWIGQRVVGEINLACGECSWCTRGLGRHCSNRTVLGIVKHPGAFAEFLTLPMRNLHRVPDAVPDEVAVFTEPVAAACAILERHSIPAGEPVAVLGDGKLGLLVAMVLQLQGARVDLYGRHPEKMAIAEQLGVRPHSADEESPMQYATVVEVTGSEAGLARAIAMTEPRGTVVMKSTITQPLSIDMASVIVPEISLVGSRCGRFLDALTLLMSEALPVREMLHDRFALQKAPAAFQRAAEKGVLKVLLQP